MAQRISFWTIVVVVFMALLVLLASLPAGSASADAAGAIDGCPPPANDDIANAIVVDGIPFEHLVDTTCATTATSDPDCFGRGTTVWYSFMPEQDYELWVSTVLSDYDTTLSVYRQDAAGLTRIACEYDAQFGLPAVVSIDVTAGETYYVMVGSSNDGPGGNLRFRIYLRQRLALEIERKGSLEAGSGSAVVTGVLQCARLTTVFIEVSVSQRVGEKDVLGSAQVDVPCDGLAEWSVLVPTCCGGSFVKGRAEVSASALTSDTGGFVSADATEVLRLKRHTG